MESNKSIFQVVATEAEVGVVVEEAEEVVEEVVEEITKVFSG